MRPHDLPMLSALWPWYREYLAERDDDLPPLDDYEVAGAARRGDLPEWATDKVELVRRLGGRVEVVKPRTNLDGMAAGAERVVQRAYTGPHVSTDWAIRDGLPLWGIATLGLPGRRFGEFAGWHCPHAPTSGAAWLQRALGLDPFFSRYTGVLNVETIGVNVIEAHMRPSVEFFRLYGRAASFAVVDAARGEAPDMRPPVTGGILSTVAHDAHVETVHAVDMKETSWRRALIFVTPPGG